MQKPMTQELANKVYSVLVELCGAPESSREQFCNYFMGLDGDVYHEYRIGGSLGSGGKFKYFGVETMYVDYYAEMGTPAKAQIKILADEALKKITE